MQRNVSLNSLHIEQNTYNSNEQNHKITAPKHASIACCYPNTGLITNNITVLSMHHINAVTYQVVVSLG